MNAATESDGWSHSSISPPSIWQVEFRPKNSMDSQKPINRARKRKRRNANVEIAAFAKQPAKTRRNAKQARTIQPDSQISSLLARRSPAVDPAQESPLCEICSAVLDKYELAEDLRTILATSEDLEGRAKEGCRLCVLFLTLMTDEEKIRLQRRTRRHNLEYIKSRELQLEGLSSRRLILSSGDLADPDSISQDILLMPTEGKYLLI